MVSFYNSRAMLQLCWSMSTLNTLGLSKNVIHILQVNLESHISATSFDTKCFVSCAFS
eukprot:c4899_g2_i1 orf=168-341(+)